MSRCDFDCRGGFNRLWEGLQSEDGRKATLYRQKDPSALMHKIPMDIVFSKFLISNSTDDSMSGVIEALNSYNLCKGLNPAARTCSRLSAIFKPHKINDHSLKLMVEAGTSEDGRPLFREASESDNFDDVFAIQSPGEYLDTTPESLTDELSAVATLKNFLDAFKLSQAKVVATNASAAVAGSAAVSLSASGISMVVIAKDMFTQINEIYKTHASGKDLSKQQKAMLFGWAADILLVIDAHTGEVLSPQIRAILFGVTELVKKLYGQELSQSAELTAGAGASEGAEAGAGAGDLSASLLSEGDTAGFAESTKDQAIAAGFAELLEAFVSGAVGVASLRQVFRGLWEGTIVIPQLPEFSGVDFVVGGTAAVGSAYVTWFMTLISKEASGFSDEELEKAKAKLKADYPNIEGVLSRLREGGTFTAKVLRELSRIFAASSEPLKDTAVLYAILKENDFSLQNLAILLTVMFPMRFFKEYSVAQKPYADLLNKDLMLNSMDDKWAFLKGELSMSDENIKSFFDTEGEDALSYTGKANLVMKQLVDTVHSDPLITGGRFADIRKKCQWLCDNFLGEQYSTDTLTNEINTKFPEDAAAEEGGGASTSAEVRTYMSDKEKREGLLGMFSEKNACQRCIRRCFAALPRKFIELLRQATPPAMAGVYGFSAFEGLKQLNEAATGTKSIFDMSPTSSVPTNAIIIALKIVWASNIAQGAAVAASAVESQFSKMTNEARAIAELKIHGDDHFEFRSKGILAGRVIDPLTPEGDVAQARAMSALGASIGAGLPAAVAGDFTSDKPPAPTIFANPTSRANGFALAGALAMDLLARARSAMYWTVASDIVKNKLQELETSGASDGIKSHYTNLIAAYKVMAGSDKEGDSNDEAAIRAGRSAFGSDGGLRRRNAGGGDGSVDMAAQKQLRASV